MKAHRKRRGEDNDANTVDSSFSLECQQRADRTAASAIFRSAGRIVLSHKKQTDFCLFAACSIRFSVTHKKE